MHEQMLEAVRLSGFGPLRWNDLVSAVLMVGRR
jgi:hypothetical protein